MQVFVPCRHTLGDVLSGYFCCVNYGRPNPKAEVLARLRNACLAGACTSAFVVTTFNFWQELDFPISIRSAASFPGDVLAENGWLRDRLDGHANLLRCPPPELFRFPATPTVPLPLRPPNHRLPEGYILFTDGAGEGDRQLSDPNIIRWLRMYSPVIRVGNSGRHWRLPMGPQGNTDADPSTNWQDAADFSRGAQSATIPIEIGTRGIYQLELQGDTKSDSANLQVKFYNASNVQIGSAFTVKATNTHALNNAIIKIAANSFGTASSPLDPGPLLCEAYISEQQL